MLALFSGPDATVLAATVVGLPATIAAFASVRAARQATGAKEQASATNQAVNDVGPGKPRLRDVADTIQAGQLEQNERLAAIELALNHGAMRMGSIESTVTRLDSKIDQHLAWHQAQIEQGTRVADAQLAEDLDDDGGQT